MDHTIFSCFRSSKEQGEYSVYQSDSEVRHYPCVNGYYEQVDFDGISNINDPQKVHSDGESINSKVLCNSSIHYNSDTQGLEEFSAIGKNESEADVCDDSEAPSSLYVSDDIDVEPVDFENNGFLWLPPEPEDEEDEREASLLDDDDDYGTGEWGCLHKSSSFGSHRDRSSEENKKAMKSVVDGHFRALVAQLLQVENLPVEDKDKNSWLEIITSLSWEAATILKPDMSKSGGMDPGGYVKVKCLASGSRSER